VAKTNKKIITHGPMPQGQFLECMGIRIRCENLAAKSPTQAQRQLLEDSYVRLCSPEQMGEIYKFLYLGHKNNDDIFPFLGEKTEKKEEFY
jgi:SAM-dependent MidA family methyltransferase